MPGLLFICQEPDTTVVPDVTVRLYDSLGDFQSQVVTDADGRAEYIATAEGEHTARFYMAVPGFAIETPQAITVVADGGGDDSFTENTFDVTVTLFSRPTSSNPRLCTCSGFFLNINGQPAKKATIRFNNISRPLLLDSSAVLGEVLSVTTDEAGYAQVDLMRTAVYRVEVEGLSDLGLEIRVPDTLSANLPDVLFPVVSAVTFTPASTTLAIAETKTIPTVVVYRSGLRVGLDDFDPKDLPVSFVADVSGIASISAVDGGVAVIGLAAGTVVFSIGRVLADADSFIQAVPTIPAITGTLTVVVS